MPKPLRPIRPKQQALKDWQSFCRYMQNKLKSLEGNVLYGMLVNYHKTLKLRVVNKHELESRVYSYTLNAIKDENYIIARLAFEWGFDLYHFFYGWSQLDDHRQIVEFFERHKQTIPLTTSLKNELIQKLMEDKKFSNEKAEFCVELFSKKILTEKLCASIYSLSQEANQRNFDNDSEKVEKLIEDGALLNALVECDDSDFDAKPIGDTSSPLHIAAACGINRLVERMLRKRANIELRDSTGETPLLIACIFGERETVQLLLKHNAYTEAVDRDHIAGLSFCSDRDDKTKSLEMAKALLNAGCNIDIRDYELNSPLLRVSEDINNMSFFKLFLNKGANKYVINKKGETPLSRLASYDLLTTYIGSNVFSDDMGLMQTLGSLKQGLPDIDINKSLKLALESKKALLIKSLIVIGANVFEKNGNSDVCEILCSIFEEETESKRNNEMEDLSVWFLDKHKLYKDMVVHIRANDERKVRLFLIERNLPPCFYFYGFLNAVKQGNINIVKLFLEQPPCFDIMGRDHEGRTALHIAVLDGGESIIPIIKCILPYFSFIILFDKNRETPLSIAIKQGQLDILKAFVETGAVAIDECLTENGSENYGWNVRPIRMIDFAFKDGNVDAVKYFLQQGAFYNKESEHLIDKTSRTGLEIHELLEGQRDRRQGKGGATEIKNIQGRGGSQAEMKKIPRKI